MIKLTNLNKQIDDLNIVKDVNLTIKDGNKLGIIGKSGAGKSTLLKMINYLIEPSSGNVIIDGVDLSSLNNKDLQDFRKNIGFVFQQYNLLLQKSVYDNIKISLTINNYPKDLINDRVHELLELVGLSDKKDDYPKTLSGGETQRVAIARALANNPKYLLCDEITSALDKKTTFEILDLLDEINKTFNTTIIFVSHDIDAVKYLCDEVVVMENAMIVEVQKTLDLFINPLSDFGKELVSKKIFDYQDKIKDDIYKITYYQDEANMPVISEISKTYDVKVNILFAEVIQIKKIDYGFLYVNLVGKEKDLALKELKRKLRVNKYV